MTTTAYLKAVPSSVADIPLQPASQDIWEKKYRLISKDGAVIDETIVPSKYLTELTKILKVEMDDAGFAQTGNVHRISVFTNRKGIMAAGPARTVQSAEAHAMDASNAALSVFGLVEDKSIFNVFPEI